MYEIKVSVIVAMGRNREIGKDNNLLWHLPDDMLFFKNTTLHHPVLMGRKNYESIPLKFRPLANRTNIVISKNSSFAAPGCFVVKDIDAAIEMVKYNGEPEAFVIGGGQVYDQVMARKLASTLYITLVDAEFPDADTWFPLFDNAEWKKTLLIEHSSDISHHYPFSIYRYDKRK
ncbi:MAG: dihydrofolate reductase [Crocinitomicaceae bacterium]|nr:dihydrofolate reductase [Crocinitomicaceae bacterium]